MGLGKTVVVTDGPEVSRFPESTLVKVEAGLAEEEMLACSLLALLTESSATARIGAAARRWISTEHAPELVARQFLAALVDYN